MNDFNHPIYIIGAGVAGLSCAQHLKSAGFNVVVLEARDRIGGRIHTQNIDGHCFDLGASWIHGIDNNPIWKIAESNRISTQVFNYDQVDYFHANGQPFTEQESLEFEKCLRDVQKVFQNKSKEQDISAFEQLENVLGTIRFQLHYFDRDVITQKIKQYYSRLANDPFATDLEQLAHNFMDFEGYFSGDEVIFPKGYEQIVKVLATDLEIHTNADIVEIDHDSHQVQIKTACGQLYIGSQVVVTVPLGILKQDKIKFEPPLPSGLVRSIQKLGFGSFNKIFIQFSKALEFNGNALKHNTAFFWDERELYSILDFSRLYNKPTYLLLVGGTKSEWVDQATDQQVHEYIKKILKICMHSNEIQNIIITRWGSDPFSLGSFSFPKVEHTKDDVEIFKKEHPAQVYFAGEHCHTDYAGTVHGAYLSGRDTANLIIRNGLNIKL